MKNVPKIKNTQKRVFYKRNKKRKKRYFISIDISSIRTPLISALMG